MTDDDLDSTPISNPPFSSPIRWRVFNEEIFPSRVVSARMVTSGRSTGTSVGAPEDVQVPQSQLLTLAASVNGRARFETLGVTRAVLTSVTPERTLQTKSLKYGGQLATWGGVWIVAFALVWPALASVAIFGVIAAVVVVAVAAPFFAGAVVDFFWWSGRGFASETRSKWILAAVLWALDVAPLVVLQIRVG